MAKEKHEADDYAFKAYLTEAAKILTENTAHHGGGNYMAKRWLEIIDTTPPPPEDNRTCNEIVSDMWERIRGEQK